MSWTGVPSCDVNLCMLVRGGRPSTSPILEQQGEGFVTEGRQSGDNILFKKDFQTNGCVRLMQYCDSTSLQGEAQRLNHDSL